MEQCNWSRLITAKYRKAAQDKCGNFKVSVQRHQTASTVARNYQGFFSRGDGGLKNKYQLCQFIHNNKTHPIPKWLDSHGLVEVIFYETHICTQAF